MVQITVLKLPWKKSRTKIGNYFLNGFAAWLKTIGSFAVANI